MPNVVIPEESGPGNKTQGWLQSDKQAHTAMWQFGLKHPTALAVLHFMISKLNRGANGIIISSEALSRQMNIGLRTAKGAVRTLKDARFVQIYKTGNSNVYVVNSKVAWQGQRGMRYASFNAQIIVDETEQLKTIEELEIESGQLIEVPVMEMEMDSEMLADIEAEVSKPKKKKALSKPDLQQNLI